MKTISIIYFTGSGTTEKIATAIAQGIQNHSETKVNTISINGDDIIKGRYKNDDVMSILETSDTIIFGSPTYMAGVSAQFKAFADATVNSWVQQKWSNKLAAGFTISGTPSGDKLNTLQYLQSFAMQHGMIWIGTGEMPAQPNGINRLGSWLGLMAESAQDAANPINADDLFAAEVFGKRIATVVNQ